MVEECSTGIAWSKCIFFLPLIFYTTKIGHSFRLSPDVNSQLDYEVKTWQIKLFKLICVHVCGLQRTYRTWHPPERTQIIRHPDKFFCAVSHLTNLVKQTASPITSAVHGCKFFCMFLVTCCKSPITASSLTSISYSHAWH